MFIHIFNIIFVISPSLYPKIVKWFFFNIKDYCLHIFLQNDQFSVDYLRIFFICNNLKKTILKSLNKVYELLFCHSNVRFSVAYLINVWCH